MNQQHKKGSNGCSLDAAPVTTAQTRQRVVIASTGRIPSAEVIAEIMKHINRPLAARTLATMCAEHAVTVALRLQDKANAAAGQRVAS